MILSQRRKQLFQIYLIPLLTHLFLIFFSILVLYPVILVLRQAFSPDKHFILTLSPFPETFSLNNFKTVIFNQDMEGRYLFFYQFFNSILVSVATTVVGVFLACTAAYAFSRFKFPGRKTGMMAFLVTQMFPGTLLMIPLYILMDVLGLLNNLLGLVFVYSTIAIPFCVWMLKGYFDTIPKELEESARIDGAGRIRIFWSIMLPVAKPAIVVTALFSFMTAWNEFILAATFMNKPENYTFPVQLQRYVGAHTTAWGEFAAGAIIVSVPVTVLFFLLQKHLVGGLTKGSVKG